MRCLWLLLTLCLMFSIVSCKKKKFEGDFEFVDQDDKSSIQKPIAEKKKWIHDSSSDLCKPLNCKKKEVCLLEDAYTAVCISKKELHKDRYDLKSTNDGEDQRKVYNKIDSNSNKEINAADSEDGEAEDDVFYDSDVTEQDEDCKPCPVIKPSFLCGSDNRTYSSVCRLDYHNCIHTTAVKVTCKGFCPCKADNTVDMTKQQRMTERQKKFQTKYKMTVEKDADEKLNLEDDENNNHYNHIKPHMTFTPEDVKYDNKHYKYIKYSSYKKDHQLDKHKVRGYNDVLEKSNSKLPKFSNSRYSMKSVECKPQQLTAIGNRLLDWFSVIMADSKKRRQHAQKSKAHFPAACKTEARWMFGHMDLNNDGSLSTQELYDLEHDQNERCIKPFIDSCDLDEDNTINPREWCRCFEKTDRPCAAVRRRIGGDLQGVYAPDCDTQGFYKPTQCHKSVGVCWCVDKHGVEFANTRTRSKPNCEETINNAASILRDDEDDDTEEDSSEGSADNVLVF